MSKIYLLFSLFVFARIVFAQANFDPVVYPGQDRTWQFHGAAGTTDTSAVSKDDVAIVGWATGYRDVMYGDDVSENWRTPAKALGQAVGDSFDIVCLGRSGQITLTFANAIVDGPGFDFAVFENGFSNNFLELAWVEVSTDGIHFVRFPNFSYTAAPTGALTPTKIHGYASKYRQGYGTPFDLDQLQRAYDAAIAETDKFHTSYETQLEANFPYLDLHDINYVRMIDIVGDGSALDCEGIVIYDPYPTSGSAGFDLEAIAVLNEKTPLGTPQSIDFSLIKNQRIGDGTIALSATASSGLPIVFEIIEGPALLNGSVVSFTGLGQVVVRASQSGDETYAPAVPLTRAFTVADELQHICIMPIANQTVGASNIQLSVSSSSGLPVSVFVDDGPVDAGVGELNHLFSSGSAGTVVLRGSQIGGELGGVNYAPAEDVLVSFDVVAVDSPLAPKHLSQWQTENTLPVDATLDSDGDGSSDLEEYAAGTDASDATDKPRFEQTISDSSMEFVVTLSQLANFDLKVEAIDDLNSQDGWDEMVPKIVDQDYSQVDGQPVVTLTLEVSRDAEPSRFWRLTFEAN